jgi:hypothetical protein
VANGEYKLVALPLRLPPEQWEAQINAAADEDYEWVGAFSVHDGTFAVMRREREE